MSKWLLRHGGQAATNRRRLNRNPYRKQPKQLRRTKRKNQAVRVDRSTTTTEETPPAPTFQEQALRGSFPGYGLDFASIFTGFNPAYNTTTTCNKCNALAQEMKNRPRSYEEIFQMALSNMLQKNAATEDLEIQTDSRNRQQDPHSEKCNNCQVLGSEVYTTRATYGQPPFSGSFYYSNSSCVPYHGQSVVDRYQDVFERPLQSKYCRTCEDRGIYNCNAA